MKLTESQMNLLNELLEMATYINVYTEIEKLLKKGEQPNWSEIEHKYNISCKQSYDVLMQVKKDMQEELTAKIEIENKAREEQRQIDDCYIKGLEKYIDKNL